MSEFFDVLDEKGNKTGKTKERALVHRDGDWHRSVHVWIVNDKHEVLLQKRSPNKDLHPNKWDISSAGHLVAGDDSVTGALREVKEELGIILEPHELKYLTTMQRKIHHRKDFINSEFSDIYLVHKNIDLNTLTLQKEEVTEVRYISLVELKYLVKMNAKDLVFHNEEYDLLFKTLEL